MIGKQSDTMAYMSETSVRILGRNDGSSISLLIYNFNEFLFLWVIRVSIKKNEIDKIHERRPLSTWYLFSQSISWWLSDIHKNFYVVRESFVETQFIVPGTGFIQVIDQEAVTV